MPDTLYIADIDPLVDESQVKEALGLPQATVKVVYDPLGRGQGHAYVTVPDGSTFDGAHTFIGSSMCRVLKYDQENFERPRKPQGEGIFIKNLVPEVTAQELYTKFSQFGEIVSLRIALTPYGVTRGFAYATYGSKAAADTAIAEMNGKEHWGRKLYVGHNLPRHERVYKYEESKPEYTNLFVKGIGQQTQEQEFFDFFIQIGPIDSYSMPIDEFGTTRGFGFVNYKTHDDAVRAVQQLNNTKLGDRVIHVSRAQQRDKPPKYETPNLYIKNLDAGVTDETLADEFIQFGDIASAKVMMDENGRSRGFGFVCFQNPQAAEAAIKHMNGATVWGNTLYVAMAQRKGRPWFRQQVPQMIPMNYGVPMYMPMMMPMPMYPPYYDQGTAPGGVPGVAGVPGVPGAPGAPGVPGVPGVPAPANALPVSPSVSPLPTKSKPRRQQGYGPSLSAAVASAENASAEKEVIGEALYPKVAKHPSVESDELASEITGILLEEKKDDLLVWVDHDEILNKKIKQAVDAYEKWSKDQK